jgi:hypothetical protein
MKGMPLPSNAAVIFGLEKYFASGNANNKYAVKPYLASGNANNKYAVNKFTSPLLRQGLVL